MQYISFYPSPLGRITMASDGMYLTGLWFEDQAHYGAGLAENVQIAELPVFVDTRNWLDGYFSGEIPKAHPPIRLAGTPFRMAVWQILQKIPYCETMTYGQIARILAREQGVERISAQAVGGAVGHNPISLIVPCHRVVGSDGSLTGYAGGIQRKAFLMHLEQSRR